MKTITLLFAFFLLVDKLPAQFSDSLPFTLRFETFTLKDLPGLHSFSFATWKGKWLLVGGRLDGLHRRQPRAAFNPNDQNSILYVVDPKGEQVWTYDVNQLPSTISEQLQSTNLQFYQDDSLLVLTGGYGYSRVLADYTTFPYITVLNIPLLMEAIPKNKPIQNFIFQTLDERMAVTGGQMGKIGSDFILVGGHRFEGVYHPMDHGMGMMGNMRFTQRYTNAIQHFRLTMQNGLVVSHYSRNSDEENLHRRDFNLVPQILPDGSFGYNAFSGVFRPGSLLPYTNFVEVSQETYQVVDFNQQFSQYHCANIPLYNPVSRTTYTLFFGGMARSYPNEDGNIIEDDNIPFVKTISVLQRNGTEVHESYLPLRMPGFLGTGAEFILAEGVRTNKGVATMSGDKEVLLGYIVGGIGSSDANVFRNNEESVANKTIIKVYLKH